MIRKFSIVYFLFLCSHFFAADDIKIISSNASSILIEYNVKYTDTSEVKLDGRNFYSVDIYKGVYKSSSNESIPQIPSRIITVGVPSEFGNTITVLDGQYEIKSGQIVPSPKVLKDGDNQVYKYEVDENYRSYSDSELVTFGDYGLYRDLPVQKIKINPVGFNPANNEIKLYTRIRFRINFSQPTGDTYQIQKNLEGIVVNPETSRNWGVETGTSRLRKGKAITSSVLSSGTWYRFEASEEGIYRINRDQLSSLGINPDNVDPRTIKIYNNGGYQLPERLTADRPVDLVENAITVVGEGDGSFDEDDYILFYGRGTDFFEYDIEANEIIRRKHDFSKHNYYYITSGGANGKRMESRHSLNQPGAYQQASTKAYIFHEEDLTNIGKTGREYWGELLNTTTTSHTFMNTLDSRVPSTPVNYNFRFANTTTAGDAYDLTFQVEESGTRIYSGVARGWGSYLYRFGRELEGSAEYNGSLSENRSVLKISISNTRSNSQGHIDYFEIEYERELRAVDDELIFYSEDREGIIEYNLSNFTNSNIEVYDITDYSAVVSIEASMISGGQFIFQDEASEGNVKKYISLTTGKYKEPTNIEEVSNSNVRGIEAGADYVIITDKKFSTEAERLSSYRSSEAFSPISSTVVFIDEIYNEFSCGSVDPTAIRDFLAYAYTNWTTRPELVLLFGDGDYDYFDVEEKSVNFIPTYQSQESLDELNSFPADDYYSRISGDDMLPDVGIGRININTEAEAGIAVDKIIEYENNSNKGLWRNLITLVADDGPTNTTDDGAIHTRQTETLANNYVPVFFNKNKIYLAAYPTVNTGAGRRKPAVNQAIIDAINNGTLIVNFIGHGNPNLWTHENVFIKDVSIPQLNNEEYFFLTAATCDFGRYDIPGDPSGTEIMLLSEGKGIIAAFTAARAVYSDRNAVLNNIFYSNLFEKGDDGFPARSGTAYMLTKMQGSGNSINDQKFHFFGDPALRLNQPSLPVSIDSVNNSNLETEVQISALGNVKVKGTVKDLDGAPSDFNGEAIISVFDSEKELELKEMNYTVTMPGGLIFRGRVSVNSGEFTTDFTVPKDISYENKNGKIVAYIYNDELDGAGYTNNVIVGGTDSTAVDDGEGPSLEIYFDDLSFEHSYLVNPDFNLLVRLEDETGINTTGTGVGHKLEGIIDEDENNTIDLTKYFVGDLDAGGKSGLIDYKFTGFSEGDHKISVTAWDVYNHSTTEESYFTVVNSDDLEIREVVNYPNPFSSNTTFTFQQNLNKTLNVKVKIYTIAGRLIKELENYNILEKFVRIPWDGRDADGSILANGTYLYKLIVESTDGEYKETVLGKMAVLR